MGSAICNKGHDVEFIDWKCMYCCSVAQFFCFGTTWLCESCHNEQPNLVVRDCGGVDCPLKVPHPPASADPKESVFTLGCSLCRFDHIKEYEEAQAKIIAELNGM